MSRPKPVLLLILDGWGHREDRANNAMAQADLPNWRKLLAECPHTLVETHGLHVGLPEGQMGNSEVGHMNIGAGRIVYQELTRIDAAIADGSFFRQRRPAAGLRGGEIARRHAARVRPAQPRRRAQPRAAHLRNARPGRAPGRRADCRACVSRRPRHAAAERARLAGETAGEVCAPSAMRASRRSAGVTTRWTATSAGTGSSSPTRQSPTPTRHSTPLTPSMPSPPPTPVARPTSSSSRPSSVPAPKWPMAMPSCT